MKKIKNFVCTFIEIIGMIILILIGLIIGLFFLLIVCPIMGLKDKILYG